MQNPGILHSALCYSSLAGEFPNNRVRWPSALASRIGLPHATDRLNSTCAFRAQMIIAIDGVHRTRPSGRCGWNRQHKLSIAAPRIDAAPSDTGRLGFATQRCAARLERRGRPRASRLPYHSVSKATAEFPSGARVEAITHIIPRGGKSSDSPMVHRMCSLLPYCWCRRS